MSRRYAINKDSDRSCCHSDQNSHIYFYKRKDDDGQSFTLDSFPLLELTCSQITNKSQDTPIVDTTIISTILDPSTRTTTITTTVAPARPTVNPGCQGVLLLSRRNHQRGKTDPLYLTLVSGRADEFNIVNSSLQPQSATLRSATGQQGMYTPIFLETAEQQEAYGNQALTCSFAGNRQQPDLSCQLGALNTFYRCPSVSPNALVLSTLCNVAADAALAADCTSAPLHGDCNR